MMIKSIFEFGANLKDLLNEAAKEPESNEYSGIGKISIAANFYGHPFVIYGFCNDGDGDELMVFNELGDFWDSLTRIMEENALSFFDVIIAR